MGEGKPVAILGGGPAGLSAAYNLSKHDKHSYIFERDNIVGGLAKTLKFENFLTDIGPHVFFSKKKSLYDWYLDKIKGHAVRVKKQSRFFIDGKYFTYPVDLKNALTGVGIFKAIRMVLDYLYEKVKRFFFRKEIKNFEDYAISNFGKTLANFNILNYTRKSWGVSCKELSLYLAQLRIKNISLMSTLKSIIFKVRDMTNETITHFFYPDLGSQILYNNLQKKIESKHLNKILLNSRAVGINHDGKKIKSVVVGVKGKKKTFECTHCISSIPVTELVSIMNPPPPKKTLDAVKKLKFRSQIYVYVMLNKERVTDDNWIYFPDESIPFGRISEPKNFSKKMVPKGKTSLFVEYYVDYDDGMWKMEDKDLYDLTIRELEKLGYIRREEVIKCFTHRERDVYPLYDINFQEPLKEIMAYLSTFRNLYSTGRGGSFKYHGQDVSIEMGREVAEAIVENRAHRTDKEYVSST